MNNDKNSMKYYIMYYDFYCIFFMKVGVGVHQVIVHIVPMSCSHLISRVVGLDGKASSDPVR